MKQRNNLPLRALADLISQLSFTDEQADYRKGTHWTIHAHPWVGEEEGFDLLITIIPRPSAETVTIQGLRLLVYSDKKIWCHNRLINRKRGEVQVWFFGLPLGRHFTVRLHGVGELSEESGEGEELAIAAAPLLAKPPEVSHAELRTYSLPDRRVIALLEEGADGRAVLTIETEASECAGATVQFTVGKETGEVILMPIDLEGVWGGSYRLKQSFDSVVVHGPIFEIKPPQPQTE